MNMIFRHDNVCRIPLRWMPAALALCLALGTPAAFGQTAMPGDLDGNGAVDAADRLLMRHLLAENVSPGQVNAANADVNEDGWISGIDGVWLWLLDPPYRGGLISSALVDSISTIEAEFYLTFAGLGDLRPARYAADMYKVTYRTMTPSGGATTATGLLTLPAGRTGVLPLASYQHGTITLKTEAPSNPASTEGIGTALVYTSTGGYAAVAPDYLGLGDGPGSHPYLHAATEASAGVDMLRAGRTAAAGHAVTLPGPLFLAGYSQGGHATMALHRELEARFAAEWPLTAVAPMAGPYDLSGTMVDYVFSHLDTNNSQLVMYISYLLVMFTTVYDFVPGVPEIFQSPYDAQVVGLFDGTHGSAEIQAALPPSIAQLLRPEFIAAVQTDPDHPFRVAAWLNDTYDWRPEAPLRMYHSAGDAVVPVGNAEVALAWMTGLGAPVELVVVSQTLGHGEAAIPCLIQSRQWFDTHLNR